MIGVALVFVNEPLVMPSITPPKPAIPAATAKSAISLLAGAMPDVRAATDELRTANVARPELDFCRLWMPSVITPKIASSTITVVRGYERSMVVRPNTSSARQREEPPELPVAHVLHLEQREVERQRDRQRRQREREHTEAPHRHRDERAERGAGRARRAPRRRRS